MAKKPARRALRRTPEVIAAAIDLVEPPPAEVEAVSVKLATCIDVLERLKRDADREGSPAESKARLQNYAKALRSARKAATTDLGLMSIMKPVQAPLHGVVAGSWLKPKRSSDFVARLDAEIESVECLLKRFKVPHGSKKSDWVKHFAVALARDIIDPEPWRGLPPKRDWPTHGRLCAPTLFADGKWHKLSMLLYEAATGGQAELMWYLRAVAKQIAKQNEFMRLAAGIDDHMRRLREIPQAERTAEQNEFIRETTELMRESAEFRREIVEFLVRNAR